LTTLSYDSQPKEIVRTFYESYNKRDLAVSWDRYISLQLVMHVPGYDDRDSWLVMDNEILAAFEDLTLTVFDQVAEYDKVATRWGIGGTQTGISSESLLPAGTRRSLPQQLTGSTAVR
jgi:hypothetical protein